MASVTSSSSRLTSLDQFRGYTMLGMLLVNFLGSYPVCPRILKHTNDYCSYADTIMPQFLFAAGFAMRLSLGKRMERGGKMPWGRAVRRIFGLASIAIVWYTVCDLNGVLASFTKKSPDGSGRPLLETVGELFKREYFQTLLHIAATSLWILPVITRSPRVRMGFAFFTGLLHLTISWWFNFVWVNTDPMAIDGGPLGFISWAIPALCGTMACDAVRAEGPAAAKRIAICGFNVALFGWLISMPTVLYQTTAEQQVAEVAETEAIRTAEKAAADAGQKVTRHNEKLAPDPVMPSYSRIKSWNGSIVEPPFVPPPDARHRKWNYWMMSQRCGSLSYLVFAAGLSLLIYAFFLWACDAKGWQLGIFRTLGTNSLAAYCFADIADWIVGPWFPKRSLDLTSGLTGIASWLNTNFGIDAHSILYAVRTVEAVFGFLCFALFVYVCCRILERKGWYIRV